ncbi:MAG: ribosome silencing factor [Chlamydiia bacterium]|nr:ribosome silencing factor [Chlamydiia bacterium]
MSDILAVLQDVGQAIFDKKGANILAIDVRGVASFTDYFMIAEGTVDRHVQALARQVVERGKKHGFEPLCVEGELPGEWIVVDFGEWVVHIMTPTIRHKYALEEHWKKGKLVSLNLKGKVEELHES